MAKNQTKDLGTFDGWQITQLSDGVLEARSETGGYLKVTGNPKDEQALRQRLFAAMAESDATTGQTQAKSKAAGQPVTLVVNEKEDA